MERKLKQWWLITPYNVKQTQIIQHKKTTKHTDKKWGPGFKHE
jgi:hypothetical protein